jgi:hypothetical protein
MEPWELWSAVWCLLALVVLCVAVWVDRRSAAAAERADQADGVDTGLTALAESVGFDLAEPSWVNEPAAEYPPVPPGGRSLRLDSWGPDHDELGEVVSAEPVHDDADATAPIDLGEPVATLGQEQLYQVQEQVDGPVPYEVLDPWASVLLGGHSVHVACLHARRDGRAPCAHCGPILVGSADSPVWRSP